MSKNNGAANTGVGFLGFLALIFIVLKLLDRIDWSWIWVLSPIWVPFILFLIIGSLILIVIFIKEKYKNVICFFKGHNYGTKYEVRELSYGSVSGYVTRCTRCGKEKK